MTQRSVFSGFDKIFHSYILFLLEYKSSYCLPTLCFIWEVSDSWLKVQKPQNQSEYRILQTAIPDKLVLVESWIFICD